MANEAARHFIVQATNPTEVLHTTATPAYLYLPNGAQAGVLAKAAAQPDTTAADLAALKVDFNLLLAKLRTAGVIAT